MSKKRANADGASLTPEVSNKRRSSSAAEIDQLCSRCADIDIDQVWSSSGAKKALGPLSTWSIETCALCRFLTSLLAPALAESKDQHPTSEEVPGPTSVPTYHLYTRKTREVSMRLLQIIIPRIMVVSDSPHGHPPCGVPYIAVHPKEPPFWLRTIEPLIDFSQAKQWLKICNELHGDQCTRGKGSPTALKLIDCHTGEVVSGTTDEIYVALSYVWGQEGTRQGSSRFPLTIHDAITVTLNLGFKRLWVDKYCIDQEDQVEFHKQLQQMGAIYQRAVVTLVAASGMHANSGLPGVSVRTRTPPRSITVDQNRLSALRGTPDLLSDQYKWSSRAWTFQEGLLSTRRLIFTDEQLYFECQGFYCIEMLDIPLELWKKAHNLEEHYIRPMYRVAPNMGVFPLDGCGVDPWDIYSRIDEYSRRALTDPSDILKGMLGIFRAFERGKNSMRHLYGVPFPQMAKLAPNKTTSEQSTKRVLPIFSESLRWTLQEPSKRRKGFPSWSWTGWFGNVKWPVEYTGSNRHGRTSRRIERPRDPKIYEEAIRVSIELTDGSDIEWHELQLRYEELILSNHMSGIIYLEAYTSPVEHAEDEHSINSELRLACADGHYITPIVNWTVDRPITSSETLLAIHFYRTASRDSVSDATPRPKEVLKQHILIVQDQHTHWERVALGMYEITSGMDVEYRFTCESTESERATAEPHVQPT